LSLAFASSAIAQHPPAAPIVTPQPDPGAAVTPYVVNPNAPPRMSRAELIRQIRSKIKYVFVIFNENNSFDHEYGAFPGANGLFSDGQNPRSHADTPGFYQTYSDVNGASVTVQPFLIGPQQNATFADSTDHSHTGLAEKLDVNPATGVAAMDKFGQDEYSRYAGTPANPGTTAKQKEGAEFAKLVMAHIDCNTIPFFWQYANRFTIFDNIFATEDTPSSPNAIAMIAGQSGETQWVKHPGEASPAAETLAYSGTINGATYKGTGTATPAGVPAVGDAQPFWGSAYDSTTSGREPTGAKESWAPTNTLVNLTFATVPLTMYTVFSDVKEPPLCASGGRFWAASADTTSENKGGGRDIVEVESRPVHPDNLSAAH